LELFFSVTQCCKTSLEPFFSVTQY
jgi:hypothetical protein